MSDIRAPTYFRCIRPGREDLTFNEVLAATISAYWFARGYTVTPRVVARHLANESGYHRIELPEFPMGFPP